jgi:UDP-glucose 4-epimerase
VALYVVTGGAGFIGSHLVTALVARGDRVRVLDDLSSGRVDNLRHLEVGSPGRGTPVELHQASVTDRQAALDACRGAAGVFHEAAQVSVPASIRDPLASYEVNVMGTLQVLEACRHGGVGKVVFAASSAAYGNDPELPKVETMAVRPLSPYASGKLAGEAMLAVWGHAFGLQTVALRYFNVYGPRQADDSPYSGVIALFARALLQGKAPTIFGDGEQSRDFVHVSDVVRANLAAMDRRIDGGAVINVGTGQRVSVNQLFRSIADLVGFAGDARREPPRAGDVPHSQASIARARELLAFSPQVSLRDGLAETVGWYRSRLER